MINKSICVVVITYNRKHLLLNCLKALKNQTHSLDHIVVIDNASQDGTVDFLHANGWINNKKFTLITLPENQGGAGGFYAGIEFALLQQFDYVWLMDDDGQPALDCLETLLPFSTENNYIGPLVLNIDNPAEFCFPIRLSNSLNRLVNLSDLEKYQIKEIIPDVVIPFNGILLSSKVIEKVGLPKKEYFIWGDDMEYTERMRKFNVEIASVCQALFYHPKEISLGSPMLFNKLHFNDTESAIKLYCMCRNTISNHRLYKGIIHISAFIFKVLWFYSFTKPSLKKMKIAIKGIFHGLRNDFTHHKDYLK